MTKKDNIRTTRFENGLTILTEKMPDVRSATVGFWFRKGSRHEPENLNGISHFIEHAVFKGTARRTAFDIAKEIDRLGGNFDAFTSHETVGFVLKIVDKQLPRAFDLLADMIFNPLFDERELKRERRVILEEMKMVEDAPEDFLSEIFQANFFPESALGLPIEGTRRTVKTFDRKTTSDYHARLCQPQNIVVSCAGNVEHADIERLARAIFDAQDSRFEIRDSGFDAEDSSLKIEDSNGESSDLSFILNRLSFPPKPAAPIILKKKRGLEQAHLIIAAPWLEEKSEKRYAAHLFESIFGGGTSSRLWQTIRERHGLAYSVGAGGQSFADCGVFTIFAATSPENVNALVDLTIEEIRRVKKSGVAEEELRLAKDQTLAAVLLGLEDSGARAGNLAHQEIVFGEMIPLEETLRRVEAVGVEDVRELAEEFFQTERMALAALGNLGNLKVERERLNVD